MVAYDIMSCRICSTSRLQWHAGSFVLSYFLNTVVCVCCVVVPRVLPCLMTLLVSVVVGVYVGAWV